MWSLQLALCLVALVQWTSGMMCPYQNEESAHKPQPPLTSCQWYNDRACCDHRDTNDIIRWFYTTQKRHPQTSPECLSLLHVLRCGLVCSPSQSDFVESVPEAAGSVAARYRADKVPAHYTFRICSSFCDQLFATCGSVGGSSARRHASHPTSKQSSWETALLWDEDISSESVEFCQSLAPPGVEINVVDESRTKGRNHQCYDGRRRVASAATSFAYGSGLEADFAGRWSFMIQAMDDQGGELDDGGDHFGVSIENMQDSTHVDAEIHDMANGLYTVSFELRNPGRYRISVQLEDRHVSNSPMHTSVIDYGNCMLPKGSYRAEKPIHSLNRCSWYKETTCCTADMYSAIDDWLNKALSPLFQHESACASLFEELWCGLECSPHKVRFLSAYGPEDDMQTARVCSSFCKSLYHACQDTSLLGLSLKAVYSRHQDFCTANTPTSLVSVQVADTNCFNGSRAELSPVQSFIYGLPIQHLVTAGEQMVLFIQAVDIYGKWMTSGGEQFTIHIDGHYVDKSRIIDYHNGTYSVFYRASRAGDYKVAVYNRGVQVASSPLTVRVIAGPTDPLASTAQGPGLHRAVAGIPAAFSLTTRDEFGNVKGTNDNVMVQISGPRSLVADISRTKGVYMVQYLAEKAGQYMVRVTVDGFHITGSPFFVTVEPDDTTHASSCEIGDMPQAAVGRMITFNIIAKDKFGNKRESGGDVFRVSFDTPLREEVGEVVDNEDGTYAVSYRPTSAGLRSVSVLMLERGTHEGQWTSVTAKPQELFVGASVPVSVSTMPAASASFAPIRRLERWVDKD